MKPKTETTPEAELEAMRKIVVALNSFDKRMRLRIIEWAVAKAFDNKRRILWM